MIETFLIAAVLLAETIAVALAVANRKKHLAMGLGILLAATALIIATTILR